MIDMSNKLKDIECPLPEPYVIHYIMMSLPPIFENFKINYNSSDKKWTMTEFIAKLSQEEERLRTENSKNIINFTKSLVLVMGSLVVSFLTGKGRGKSLMNPQNKLLKKISLMKRKVSSAFIVRSMGT
jgi:hypothetical protein